MQGWAPVPSSLLLFHRSPPTCLGGVSGPCVVPEAPAAPQQGAETSLCPLYLCSLTQLKNSLPLS